MCPAGKLEAIIAPLILLAALAHASDRDCPDLGILLGSVESAIFEQRYQDGWNLLQSAEATFACAAPPTTEQLGRFWLAHATFRYLQGDKNGAVAAFGAAYKLDSGLWIEDYGPRMRQVYNAAAVDIGGDGSLAAAAPVEEPLAVYVDGQPVELPAKLPAGMHLVQIYDEEGPRWYGLIDVLVDTTTTFEYELSPRRKKRAKGAKGQGRRGP